MLRNSTAIGSPTESDFRRPSDICSDHDANSSLQNMSEHGPSQYDRVGAPVDSFVQGDEVGPGHDQPSAEVANHEMPLDLYELQTPTSSIATQTMTSQSPVEMRAHFADFAAQLRSHRHDEYKRRMLEHRRRHLNKAISLSRRLRRLGSWMHDGLVEISQHGDATAFVRVHQSIEDLTEICFSQWSEDIRKMDAVSTSERLESSTSSESFVSKLSHSSQQDCLEFINSVRSNPRFLVDRLKSVSPSQLRALSTSPRFKDLEASIILSLSQNQVPGRSSQRRRIQSYSKTLEDYGTTFERKNAISFLLHNCFGPESAEEDSLRTNTWATVCATLWRESPLAFDAIFGQIMSEFCSLHTWRARDRLELFLMDILQRGAFLLEPIGEYRTKAVAGETYVSDTLDTDGAKDFFDDAVRNLFIFLYNEDGFPPGARRLATATLGKLSTIEDQMALRGHIFFAWFMPHFLSYAIEFPEHEKMLLNFHISDGARNGILHQLWARAQVRVSDCFSDEPSQPVDPVVNGYVNAIIAQLEPDNSVQDPYQSITSPKPDLKQPSGPALTLCATDVVHVLMALSQQYMQTTNILDPVMHFSSSTFAQHSRASNRFDRLRRELLLQMEPGSSVTPEHPCQERWMIFPIQPNGRVDAHGLLPLSEPSLDQYLEDCFGSLDAAQQAVVRLALDDLATKRPLEPSSSPDTSIHRYLSVAHLFEERMKLAQYSAQNVEQFYWENALDLLKSRYSISAWAKNDSRILRPLLRSLAIASVDHLTALERDVQNLESVYTISKQLAYSALSHLNQLKIKMWYVREVINSHEYESARNISRALNYMALNIKTLPESTHSASSGWERPGTSASAASSMFEQPRLDAMEILKAPREHGGPRKLADLQIKTTKQWLERNGVENFCKGEERIHRFCMEIRTTTRKLVADTLLESPVLWSSELWAKERNIFDVGTNNTPSVHGSSRPPSVMSETLSSTFLSSRPSLGSTALSSRSLDADGASFSGRKGSFFGSGPNRLNRDIFGSEAGTAFSSPGRSLTTTSGESVSSIWSQLQSQAKSMTSASMVSRAPSILNDFGNLKLGDHNAEKARFLEMLQQDLIGLLLSDLGNPVWSLGSETDSWLDVARQNNSVYARMLRRKQTAELMPESRAEKKKSKLPKNRPPGSRRSVSTDDTALETDNAAQQGQSEADDPRHVMMMQLADVLGRIKDHVNPSMKLQAVHDFKRLALLYLDKESVEVSKPTRATSGRRRSLGAATESSYERITPPKRSNPVRTEGEIVEYLKELLLTLGPSTLFRDLQYIAAFIPLEILNKTESGKAFFQLGLAAMASKDEYCRCMVDVADSIVAKDAIKRKSTSLEDAEQPLHKARQYWILAACEGNAIAQRELASLYLAHPELPPIVSLPMALSADIFKDDMMWQAASDSNNKTQALCLAVHWMTQAANNGDEIANLKLRERKKTASIQ